MTIHALTQSALTGASIAAEIRSAAERLVELMKLAHGGRWSIDIDHDTCFVSVARDFQDEPEAKRC